jgi:uncharacterized membrane protein YkvA (DUF1232 family)
LRVFAFLLHPAAVSLDLIADFVTMAGYLDEAVIVSRVG